MDTEGHQSTALTSTTTATSAAPTRSAVAILAQEAVTRTSHKLQLVVVDDVLSTRVDRLRANTVGTWIPAPPTLAMDQAGNTYRLMWAQALAGQGWSTPKPLIPNLAELGKIPRNGRIEVSMNASGQAAAALVLDDCSSSVINVSMLSRFDFTNG